LTSTLFFIVSLFCFLVFELANSKIYSLYCVYFRARKGGREREREGVRCVGGRRERQKRETEARERERERGREREGEREREISRSEREKKRERKREREREGEERERERPEQQRVSSQRHWEPNLAAPPF
jgi:hypothetical protein